MAHFFYPSDRVQLANIKMASEKAPITELHIKPGSWAVFGVQGDQPYQVKVVRAGRVVSEGQGASVGLVRLTNDSQAGTRVYRGDGLHNGDEIQALDVASGQSIASLTVIELTTSASSLMDLWVQQFKANGSRPDDRACCDLATPYLTLTDPVATRGDRMTRLDPKRIGGPLDNVHGLSVHCTSGSPSPSAFDMATYHCVKTWNAGDASAHFGIAGDGTIVQFVVTTFGANAQGDPGDSHWISVEIDNLPTSPMTGPQLESAKKLFRWVAKTFGVPPKVATGCLYPKTPQFDKTTTAVCAAAGQPTTSDPFEAAMSQGVSCHWWLDPRKGGPHPHYCPGTGIIGQLPDIVK
jgi:hypothetical protein